MKLKEGRRCRGGLLLGSAVTRLPGGVLLGQLAIRLVKVLHDGHIRVYLGLGSFACALLLLHEGLPASELLGERLLRVTGKIVVVVDDRGLLLLLRGRLRMSRSFMMTTPFSSLSSGAGSVVIVVVAQVSQHLLKGGILLGLDLSLGVARRPGVIGGQIAAVVRETAALCRCLRRRLCRRLLLHEGAVIFLHSGLLACRRPLAPQQLLGCRPGRWLLLLRRSLILRTGEGLLEGVVGLERSSRKRCGL
mmetsp:Transcript_55382/g.119569  ORF Transcript_55382/g.119569 Transcript_55382/m.119569 type:complete len:248 (-) Transcript_55382:133-876(-)